MVIKSIINIIGGSFGVLYRVTIGRVKNILTIRNFKDDVIFHSISHEQNLSGHLNDINNEYRESLGVSYYIHIATIDHNNRSIINSIPRGTLTPGRFIHVDILIGCPDSYTIEFISDLILKHLTFSKKIYIKDSRYCDMDGIPIVLLHPITDGETYNLDYFKKKE